MAMVLFMLIGSIEKELVQVIRAAMAFLYEGQSGCVRTFILVDCQADENGLLEGMQF